MKKLAIITTHPIQYYAPIFRLISSRENIAVKVFYTLGEIGASKYDPGFGKKISWDIPLLDGYEYEWVENISKQPASHRFNGINNPNIIKQIAGWQPDAVLVYGWAYKGHLKAIRYFKNKVPVYFRGDSTLLNEPGGIKGFIKKVFLRWVYSHVDHAFYVGQNNKAYYKKYGLKEDQLTFAPHAIDNERFEVKKDENAAALRTSLKINAGDILVLYAGKFEEVKNLGLLIDAFKTLNKPNTHLLLAGNGLLESELKTMADDNHYIHFIGFRNQSQMPLLYQAADIFCLPSKSETWGLSINEAMACRKAILASDKVGCAVDLVKNGENGFIFKSGDLHDMTDNLRKLTEDKDQLVKFGKRSEEIIAGWNFTKIAEAIENKLLNETD